MRGEQGEGRGGGVGVIGAEPVEWGNPRFGSVAGRPRA